MSRKLLRKNGSQTVNRKRGNNLDLVLAPSENENGTLDSIPNGWEMSFLQRTDMGSQIDELDVSTNMIPSVVGVGSARESPTFGKRKSSLNPYKVD